MNCWVNCNAIRRKSATLACVAGPAASGEIAFTKRFSLLIQQHPENSGGGLTVQLFIALVILELPPIHLLFAALNYTIGILQAKLRPVQLLYSATLGAARNLSKKRIQVQVSSWRFGSGL